MACGNNLKVYMVGSFSAIGGFLFGYHTGVISGVLTMADFQSTMGINDKNSGTSETSNSNAINGGIVGVLLFGCFVGSLIGGQASDLISRKYSISIFSIIFTVSAALQTGSTGLPMLLVARFFAGIAIGALSMIVPIYHSEIATTRVRGRLITLQQWAITIGIAISFWMNYATHNSTLVDSGWEWRLPLGVQMIPSLVLSIGILFCPHSPRWLLSREREDEARQVFLLIRPVSPNERDEEIRRIQDELIYLRNNEINAYRQLFLSPLLRPFLLGIGIQVFQQLTGINSTIYYAPIIFKQIFPTSAESFSLLVTGINGCVNVIFTIPTIVFIDKLGRRVLLITGAIIMSISMLIVAILIVAYGQKEIDRQTGSVIYILQNQSVSWAVIIFIYVFVGGFAFSWGPIPWIYCTEIFPLTMRAKATSLTTAANWATNCAISFLVPILLQQIQYGTFIIFSIFCAIMTGLVFLFYPETNGQDLERSDRIDTIPIIVPQFPRRQGTNYNTFIQQPIDNERNSLNPNDANN